MWLFVCRCAAPAGQEGTGEGKCDGSQGSPQCGRPDALSPFPVRTYGKQRSALRRPFKRSLLARDPAAAHGAVLLRRCRDATCLKDQPRTSWWS